MSEPVPVSPAGGNRRALIFAAIGGGVLVVLLLGHALLSGGGGNSSAPPPPPAPPSGVTRTTTTTVAGGVAPETFEVFTTKNPFTPLLPTLGGSSTGTSTGGTSGTGGSLGSGSGGTSGGGGGGSSALGGSGSSSGGASGSAANAPRPSQRVALLDVYRAGGGTVADVRVNDTVYRRLAPGQTFAGSYQVVSLSGSCGSFLFGDERFRLCKGEEVLK